MSNLVPEKRVNKNGVAVTRHVRLNKRPTGLKPALPSPTLSKGRQELVDRVLGLIDFKKLERNKPVDERNRIKKAAQSLTDEDIIFAESLVDGAKGEQGKQSRRIMVRQILENGSGYSRKLRAADFLLRESKIPPVSVMSFLNTLSSSDGAFDESIYSLGEADAETQRKVAHLADTVTAMLVRISALVEKPNGSVDFERLAVSNGQRIEFTHPELGSAIIANPERSMEIVEWYRSRDYTGSIDELLNSVPALGDGAL